MIDRHNIYVLVLGHIFHLIWGTEEIDDWIFGFLGALGVELLLWEGFGNSPLVAKRIRDEIGNFGAGAFKIYHIIEGCGSSLNYVLLLTISIVSSTQVTVSGVSCLISPTVLSDTFLALSSCPWS